MTLVSVIVFYFITVTAFFFFELCLLNLLCSSFRARTFVMYYQAKQRTQRPFFFKGRHFSFHVRQSEIRVWALC